jgi:hypothetical protein
MLLNPNKIQKFLQIIEANHLIFIGRVVGVDVLSPAEKQVIKNFGVDVEELKKYFPALTKSFHWGRLSEALQRFAGQVNNRDFEEYLRRGQYIPLNTGEKYALEYLNNAAYGHIKGLGERIKSTVYGMMVESDPALRASYEEIIRDSLKRAVVERESVQKVISEIGHKTGDWERDLGRIAETELNNAFQWGRAEQIKKEQGVETVVYKDVYKGACRHCIRLYLTGGIGSKPRTFTLKQLVANGTNIGLKVADWKAVVGSTHPWCRCTLHSVPEGYTWNEEQKAFVPPIKKEREKKYIKITVGDKVFEV